MYIMPNITFSTCWYNFKAKFPSNIYQTWIHNMLSYANNYYLIIYTDNDGFEFLEKYIKENIMIIIKPYCEFHTYKYMKSWIDNHEKNVLLKNNVDWRVNMLWSEKIHFVKETMVNNYFNTDYFGWCDIGYFRDMTRDTSMYKLGNWPNQPKINGLAQNKIHYAIVNNNQSYMQDLYSLINNKNSYNLPKQPIPPNQISVAGGFFIVHKNMVNWWHDIYYTKLQLYFDNNYLIKDDQMIIINCVLENTNQFQLYRENDKNYDNWFMFQRILLE